MEIRRLRQEDLEAAWALDHDTFHTPKETRPIFLGWAQPEWFDGVFEGSRLVGLSGAFPFGQFFGGRSVQMGGVTTVAVAPDSRGRGLAKQVVRANLATMRERGDLISALYPATTHLYRQLGWEMAGATTWRRVAPRAMAGLAPLDGVRVRPAESDDAEGIEACYARFATETNGCLARPPVWWSGLRSFHAERSRFVAVADDGSVEGYVVYRQADGDQTAFRIVCDDIVWRTRRAGVALWRLLGSWMTVCDRITYRAGDDDPLVWLLSEQPSEVVATIRWMLRLIDAPGAIAARGYSEALDVAVSLEIEDAELPSNAGRCWLRVEKGEGRLEPGGPGGLQLDVGAFAALYSGGADVAQLARAGRLRCDEPASLRALAAAFAGPAPWMLDDF